jgi:hypothetical protein
MVWFSKSKTTPLIAIVGTSGGVKTSLAQAGNPQIEKWDADTAD